MNTPTTRSAPSTVQPAAKSVGPGWLARLRSPRQDEVAKVSIVGHPTAVLAVARALATVTVVTAMSHRTGTPQLIQLDLTCHHRHAQTGDRA